MSSNRQYTDEFRAEAVKQVIDRGFTVVEVAARIGIAKHSSFYRPQPTDGASMASTLLHTGPATGSNAMHRLLLLPTLLPLLASAQAATPKTAAPLDAAARSAAFRAAGATQVGKRWVICRDDPSNPSATLDEIGDLNGDGRPEVVVNESGTFCNGASETSYALLSRQADGHWRVMSQDSGMVEVLTVRGKDGWPDLSIGGPGFCFPVLRWDGQEYSANRFEYEGKRCKPVR